MTSRQTLLSAALCLPMLLGACASRTRPAVMAEAERVQQSTPSQEAAELAPASFAEAEKLRRDADQAFAAGDSTSAAILAEQAIAAYGKAFVHARSARSSRALDEAKAELSQTEAELAKLREEQARASAEVADLEMRAKVVQDALPIADSSPTNDAERQRARAEAARAIVAEARLLCVSARLLGAEAAGLADAEKALAEVDKLLEGGRAAPIDEATRARTQCLSTLSASRRASSASRNDDEADKLLSELSREGSFAPQRDDRGVVVVLHEAFSGDGLSKPASAQLDALSKVASAHPSLPLLVVVHDQGTANDKRALSRAEAARKILGREKGEKIELLTAGTSRPIVNPKDRKLSARNERLELVFVDPGAPGGLSGYFNRRGADRCHRRQREPSLMAARAC